MQARDFDNPYLSRCYYAQTGGSTGAGTRVPIDLDHLAAQVKDQPNPQEASKVVHSGAPSGNFVTPPESAFGWSNPAEGYSWGLNGSE